VKLLVDLGNTRLKWVWLERGELREPHAIAHVGSPEAPLATLASATHRPTAILLASVADPALTAGIADRLGAQFGIAPQRVNTEREALGVRNGYRDHTQLGVDRWLAIVAAFARYRQALCVVDAGTAVTLDAVSGDGAHLGGFIVPGAGLMRASLLRDTGRLAAAVADDPEGEAAVAPHWGRDTASCIRLGALHAIGGLIGHSLRKLGERGEHPLLVLTGGGSEAIRGELPVEALQRPLLVLEGLAAIAQSS